MELVSINNNHRQSLPIDCNTQSGKRAHEAPLKEIKRNPFIEANTKEVSLASLKKDCIIPNFAKDNEKTIAHHEFIQTALSSVNKMFPNDSINAPEIRVSHEVKGRVAEAIYKPVKELLEHEKTQYYERMAFIIRIPSLSTIINGNKLSLTVGGVRSYNQENLYSRKTYEKVKFFIGFQNMVCCNLCISTDGFQDEMRIANCEELEAKVLEIIQGYKAEKHLHKMKQLGNCSLTERQFAHLLGKARLYNYLPKKEKAIIPELLLNDGQISTIAKDYYNDESFCRDQNGDINMWNVYNLFTAANKSSYIDSFLARNNNALDFCYSIVEVIKSKSPNWFVS